MKSNRAIHIILVFSIPLILILGLIGYLYANQNEIKNYALQEINKGLQAKVKVNSISLALFTHFPTVSLDLNQVVIEDPTNSKLSLLTTQHVYIGFNVWDILRKNYTIRKINIEDGALNITIDKNGRTNVDLLRKNDTSISSPFLVNLNAVNFSKINLSFSDYSSRVWIEGTVPKLTLSGNFSNTGEAMHCEGLFMARKIKNNELTLIRNKLINLDIDLDLNHQSNTYSLKKGHVDIDQLKLDVSGNVIGKPTLTELNLAFKARELSIADLISLIPAQIKLPDNMISKGQVYFNGKVSGIYSQTSAPSIIFNFGVKNGELNLNKGIALQNISLDGELSNGTKHRAESSSINLTNLAFSLGKGQVKGRLRLDDFTNLKLATTLQGELAAEDVVNFLGKDLIEQASGELKFDLNFDGLISDLSKTGWLKNKAFGDFTMHLNNLKLRGNEKEIQTIDTRLKIDNKDVLLENFSAKIDRSDISITGTLQNIIPYLLSNDQKLTAKLNYSSTNLDLSNFFWPSSPTDSSAQQGIALPDNIEITAQVKANQITYQLFTAKNIEAQVNWLDKTISVTQLKAETMGGQLQLNGQIDNAKDGRFLITSNTQLKGIDITQLFKSCGDFGQSEITQKHLKGKLTGDFSVTGVWSKNMVCDLNKLYVNAKMAITNGELTNYEPLNALGKFVDVNELKNLKFADLANTIEIKNQTIYIPQFDVKNNALNITLSGTHTFANFVDYKVKIKLSELLKNKRRQNKPDINEFNEEEVTSDRGANLYLSMKGPVGDIKITYDKLGAKQKVKQDLKQEQQTIKEVLKKELGISDSKDKDLKEKKNDNDELEFEPE